ncbi:uncharacterized protein LOC119688423 [Teleopsis dalmanni]|uniref:uncharacterized protein LOC119688423 n=1 Tax=Teleopsis dalmanni TaxID=139649 RepID=UPI0018CF7252|nr:uncharacterized protein LOC119688423 [Teleopsis dalmanni]
MISARDKFFASSGSSTSALGLGIEVVDTTPTSVYNPTTMPLSNGTTDSKRTKSTTFTVTNTTVPMTQSHLGSSSQTQAVSAVSAEEENDPNKQNGVEELDRIPFSNLPSRDPVDMEFKDLSLTVNMGFTKAFLCFADDLGTASNKALETLHKLLTLDVVKQNMTALAS